MTAGLQFKHKCGDIDKAMLDIIFIHGITGDPEETWTNSAGVFWPSWLAKDLSDVCVFTAGYPSSLFERWAKKEMNLHERAASLAEHMASCGIGKRPLIIVCHSLGGLLAKEIFRACCEAQDEGWSAIANNLKLVVFYATPHKGAPLAGILKMVFPRLSSQLVNALSNDGGYLTNLHNAYRDQTKSMGVASIAYYELHKTKNVSLVVSENDADPGCGATRPLPLDADHIGICKPGSQDDDTAYISLRRHIGKVLEENEPEEFNIDADIWGGRSQDARRVEVKQPQERVSEFIQKSIHDAGELEETIRDFSKKRRIKDEVYILSQRAVTELDALNIERAKMSIALASDTQVAQNLMDELSAYSSLKLMWGRAELLDGEIESATKTFLSIGAMLKHFDPVEAARYLSDAGRTCFNHGQSYGGPALWSSIQIYKRASGYIRKGDHAREWAKIKNYLGESYRLMGRRNVDAKYQFWLDTAIKQYRSSLSALSIDGDGYDSAMVNANIALAYGYKGRFEDQRSGLINLQESCELFEDTLAGLPSVEKNLLAAKICHYLGNVYGEIGIRSSGKKRTDQLEISISRYEASLRNAEFCESSERRANTLNNLSNAIIHLHAGNPSRRASKEIFDAKRYCEEALVIRDKDRFPLEFAQTSTNLAHVYLIIARSSPEESLAHLRLAQRKCNEARQIRSPDEVPLDWAETRLLQGEISEQMEKMTGDSMSQLYEDPIEIYSDILKVVEDANIPYYKQVVKQRLTAAQS